MSIILMVHIINGGLLFSGVVVRFVGVMMHKWSRRRLVRPLIVSGLLQGATGGALLLEGASVLTMCVSAIVVVASVVGFEAWMMVSIKHERKQRI